MMTNDCIPYINTSYHHLEAEDDSSTRFVVLGATCDSASRVQILLEFFVVAQVSMMTNDYKKTHLCSKLFSLSRR
jgi:hypothetical protein